MTQNGKIQDTYFRRVFVPIILAILVLAGIAVILYTTPGSNIENIGVNFQNMVGGFRRVLRH